MTDGGHHKRKNPRFRVHLSVRYESAADFVREYAENLSAGGLFVRGATDLPPLERVQVTISLPAFGEYQVTAEVAHVITEEQAERFGRSAGAGMALVDPDPEFQEALNRYLLRLGKRADMLVLVGHEPFEPIVAATGYKVETVASPHELAGQIGRSDVPVAGIIVRGEDELTYAAAAKATGAGDIVFAMESEHDLDEILERLDDELWS